MVEVPPSMSLTNLNNKIQAVGPLASMSTILSELPSEFLTLSSGAQFTGTVVGKDAQGNILLQTANGQLLLNSLLPLIKNDQLHFKIVNTGSQFQAQLMNLNGQLATQTMLSTLIPQRNTIEMAGAGALKLPLTTVAFQELTIFKLLKPSPVTTAIESKNPIPTAPAYEPKKQENFSKNAEVTTITSLRVPVVGNNITSQFLSVNALPLAELLVNVQKLYPHIPLSTIFHYPAQQNNASLVLPKSPEGVAQWVAHTLTPGATATFTLTHVAFPVSEADHPLPLPSTTNPSSFTSTPSLAPATQDASYKSMGPMGSFAKELPVSSIEAKNFPLHIKGTVIASNHSGETIILTPIGTFSAQFEAELPKHTELALSLVSLSPMLTPLSLAAQTPQEKGAIIQQLVTHWRSLQSSIETLARHDPKEAETLLKTILPNTMNVPNAPLAYGMEQLIQSLKENQLEQWLTDKVIQQLQEQEQAPLLQQLQKEFQVLSQYYSQPSPEQNFWQFVLMPIFDGEMLQQARFFVHDYSEKTNSEKEGGKNVRFIVELEAESFGVLQFDGLVRHGEGKKFFDLIIRSKVLLSDEIQQDIRTIYQTANEITGTQGGILFQNVSEFPVNPIEHFIHPIASSIIV